MRSGTGTASWTESRTHISARSAPTFQQTRRSPSLTPCASSSRRSFCRPLAGPSCSRAVSTVSSERSVTTSRLVGLRPAWPRPGVPHEVLAAPPGPVTVRADGTSFVFLPARGGRVGAAIDGLLPTTLVRDRRPGARGRRCGCRALDRARMGRRARACRAWRGSRVRRNAARPSRVSRSPAPARPTFSATAEMTRSSR